MTAISPIEIVSAHPWKRVAFTTFALSLSFFEAVVLDALVRGGGRSPLIFADVAGVRTALSELGAVRVGQQYEVEPVAVRGGVFHPKLGVFVGDEDCHLLVGSGNLTFGGWGGNLECLEHLHPSFAADAVLDAANFFEMMVVSDRLTHGAGAACEELADALRRSAQGRTQSGTIRLLHSFDGSISDRLAQVADDLGGAKQMLIASPYFDQSAQAVDELCQIMGLAEVFVHAHNGGTAHGSAGTNWPFRATTQVVPVEIADFGQDRQSRSPSGRLLHAKTFEIICNRGRILLSGSANATSAALNGSRNIEASVIRIDRNTLVGWEFVAATVPPPVEPMADKEEEDRAKIGILRAELSGDEIHGNVLSLPMRGTVEIMRVTAAGREKLGSTAMDANSGFRIEAPGLELESWAGGRLIVRIEQSNTGLVAEGFVSVSSFGELRRRAGPLAPRLLALISGTETPADVAAIMSWFHEDPLRLRSATLKVGGGTTEHRAQVRAETVSVVSLGVAAVSTATRESSHTTGTASWMRFMDHVYSAFRGSRGPIVNSDGTRPYDDEDDDTGSTPPVTSSSNPARQKALAVFEKLFDLMVAPGQATRNAIAAFELSNYICDRLRPDELPGRRWLDHSLDALVGLPLDPVQADAVAAAVLLKAAASRGDVPRLARSMLIRLGLPVTGDCPSLDSVAGFAAVIGRNVDIRLVWDQVSSVRTYQEQMSEYWKTLQNGLPYEPTPDLLALKQWPILASARSDSKAAARLLPVAKAVAACPRCHIAFPLADRSELEAAAITSANCCARLVLVVGESI